MKAQNEADGAVRELSAVFFLEGVDGRPAFTEDELENFLPLVFMRAMKASDAPTMSPRVELFLAEFAAKIGVRPGMSAHEVQGRMAAHYEAHPVNPALATAFNQVLREQTALYGASGTMGRLAEFVGERMTNEGYRAGAPRPEGTLPAGPLARFKAADTLPKRDASGTKKSDR